MKKQLEPQQLRQKEKSTQHSAHQSTNVGLSNQSALQSVDTPSQSAIPVGEDSISTMTDAPMQCKKESRGEKKARKAEEAEYNAAFDAKKAEFITQSEQAREAAAANPEDQYRAFAANRLHGNVDNISPGSLAGAQWTSTQKYFDTQDDVMSVMNEYGSRDGVSMLTSLYATAETGSATMDTMREYMDNAFLLTHGVHHTPGTTLLNGREGTQEEFDAAYDHNVEETIVQGQDIWDYAHGFPQFYNNQNLTITDMVNASYTSTELFAKIQPVKILLGNLINRPEYGKLSRERQAFLLHTYACVEATFQVVRTMVTFLSQFHSKGYTEAHSSLSSDFKMAGYHEMNLDTQLAKATSALGTPDKPNLNVIAKANVIS